MMIAGHNFKAPLKYSQLKHDSGVYAVLDSGNRVVDVGESHDVKARIDDHDRKSCWRREGHKGNFAVHYASSSRRKSIEKKVRQKRKPPCGQR